MRANANADFCDVVMEKRKGKAGMEDEMEPLTLFMEEEL